MSAHNNEPTGAGGSLSRQLGLFGTTLAVMGGIIGAGILHQSLHRRGAGPDRAAHPRGLGRGRFILGVLAVIAIQVSVNFVYLRALGAEGLAQSMLTAPRVYFAMAEDGVFFRAVARISPRSRVPIVAIILQGGWAIVIALAGTYAQVVNYVVAMDCNFFGLTAVCLFVLRRRASEAAIYRVPGHPWTTLLFIAAQWLIVASTFAHDPQRAFIGLGIALAGLPVYFLWR